MSAPPSRPPSTSGHTPPPAESLARALALTDLTQRRLADAEPELTIGYCLALGPWSTSTSAHSELPSISTSTLPERTTVRVIALWRNDYAGQDPTNSYDLAGTFNGCGPGNTLLGRIATKFVINPWGSTAGAEGACRFHDNCYGRWGSYKSHCDIHFENLVVEACNNDPTNVSCWTFHAVVVLALDTHPATNAFVHSQQSDCPYRRKAKCDASLIFRLYVDQDP